MPRSALLMLTATLLFTSSCAGEVCDPTGNWSMTLTWSTDDCGLTDPLATTVTVTNNPSGGYLISESDPSVTIAGTITDQDGACRLSMTETDPDVLDDGTTTGQISYNVTADVDGVITGSGTLSFSGDLDCSQTFSVTGAVQ
jgi:archaellum component FlaG (FlaF/FlaG flagellin family)